MFGTRGQLTLFVIIGLVIIAILGSVYVITNNNVEDQLVTLNDREQVVKDNLYDCFESEARDSIHRVLYQGGYYDVPLTNYLDTGEEIIPFYYFAGETYTPNKFLIEEAIMNDFYVNSFRCLDDLLDEHTYRYGDVNVSIDEQEILILLDLEITVNFDNQSNIIDFNHYPIQIRSKIDAMQKLANDVAWSYKLSEEKLCLTCFLETTQEEGLEIDFENEFKGLLFVTIVDEDPQNAPNFYQFLLSYESQNQSIVESEHFELRDTELEELEEENAPEAQI